MTDDFKTNLFNYLNKNLTTGTGNNTPFWSTPKYIESNLDTTLKTIFPNGYSIVFNGKNAVTGNNYLVANSYVYNEYKSCIILLDDQGNILATTTQYKTGTALGKILCFAEDEDGQYYGIDQTTSSIRHIILLNNITLLLNNEMSIILRNDYTLPSDLDSYTPYDIDKSNGSAEYLISTSTGIANKLAYFQINVGSTNVWKYWTPTRYNEDPKFKIIGKTTSAITFCGIDMYIKSGIYTIKKYIGSSDITTLTESDLGNAWDTGLTGHEFTIDNVNIINSNKMYLGIRDYYYSTPSQWWTYDIKQYYYIDNTLTQLNKIKGYADTTSILTKYIYIDNIMFTLYKEAAYVPELYVTIVNIDKSYINFIFDLSSFSFPNEFNSDQNYFNIYKENNLYRLIIDQSKNITADKNITIFCSMIYNENNYNGLPFISTTALSSNQGILKDNADDIVYASNLYNKTLQSNQAISTIQLANWKLTNIDLTSQLWSKNNNIIVNSSNIINHNQYEELLINFINIINIQNKNALNNIYNVIGATRLTTSTNNVYDYQNASIGYYRVNYSDSTYADFDAKISNYILVDNLPTAQYEMVVYIPDDKLVNNIQLISNDKMTIYQTIDMTGYSTGLYNITQNVKIE
jgi:hypothetical protein